VGTCSLQQAKCGRQQPPPPLGTDSAQSRSFELPETEGTGAVPCGVGESQHQHCLGQPPKKRFWAEIEHRSPPAARPWESRNMLLSMMISASNTPESPPKFNTCHSVTDMFSNYNDTSPCSSPLLPNMQNSERSILAEYAGSQPAHPPLTDNPAHPPLTDNQHHRV
jgi:hypothetical protein